MEEIKPKILTNPIDEDEYIKNALKFLGRDWNGYSYQTTKNGGTSQFGGKVQGDKGILSFAEFQTELRSAIDTAYERMVDDDAATRALNQIATFVGEDGLVTGEVIEKFRATSIRSKEEAQKKENQSI